MQVRPALSPLSAPPGAPRPQAPRAPEPQGDGYAGTVSAAEEPEKKGRHWKRTAAAVGLAGLATMGVVGGVAGHVLLRAPVCAAPEPAISISLDGVCVNAETGANAQTAWRHIRGGAVHSGHAVFDLASGESRVLQPSGDHRPPAAPTDGTFRTVSWNVHHEQSPDSAGARDQLEEIQERLRDTEAEVIFLQEVSPWNAQDLADATGMVAYYSQTTTVQGNMILVHPDLAVTEQAKVVTTAAIEPGSERSALEALDEWRRYPEDREPRMVQALRVDLPNGDTYVVWNTHMATSGARPETREAERATVVEFVEEFAGPGEAIVGGGDLNDRAAGPTTSLLRENGFDLQGASIDWIVTRDLPGRVEVRHGPVLDPSGAQVSDHPIVIGEVSPHA